MPDPIRLGWWLSAEERDPRALVRHAVEAEEIGLPTAMISDHLQPWVPRQGHAGHAWTVLGAIAQATERLEVGTGVTAMVHRSHPITIAHAAATVSLLFDGRFFLGVGTGERLNERAFGARWPRPGERRTMLEEAIGVIRALWEGSETDHDGDHWKVEHLTLWERPVPPPSILVAASGRRSAELAASSGDGIIGVAPDASLSDAYRGAGGQGRCSAQLHVSLAATDDEAVDQAWEWWPNGGVAPAVLSELARPEHFEAVAASTRREAIHDTVVCARDAGPIIEAIERFAGSGFDTVYLHQVGPDQARLADLVRLELLPHFGADAERATR